MKKVGDGFLIKNPGSNLTIGRPKIQIEIKIKISQRKMVLQLPLDIQNDRKEKLHHYKL